MFGGRRYLTYFLVCVVSAAITQLLFAGMTGGFYPTVGASGGVFGLLLAYAMYFPNNRIMLLIPPIPMRARTFVLIYASWSCIWALPDRRPASLTSPILVG